MRLARAVEADSRCPVARGLGEQLACRPGGEGLIAGPVEVARRGPGDVGDDVLLGLTGANAGDLSGREMRM